MHMRPHNMEFSQMSGSFFQKKSLANKLYKWKKTGTLCDLVIKTQGNVTFLLHKVIVCASSEFLKTMVVAQGSRLPTIDLSRFNIRKEIFELLVDFMYDQPIQHQEDNIEALIDAARTIGLDELLEIYQRVGLTTNFDEDENRLEYSDIKEELTGDTVSLDGSSGETQTDTMVYHDHGIDLDQYNTEDRVNDVEKFNTGDNAIDFDKDSTGDGVVNIDKYNTGDVCDADPDIDAEPLTDANDEFNDNAHPSDIKEEAFDYDQFDGDSQLTQEYNQLTDDGQFDNVDGGTLCSTSKYDKESDFDLKECAGVVKRINSEIWDIKGEEKCNSQTYKEGFSFYRRTANNEFHKCKKCRKTFLYKNALRDHVNQSHLNLMPNMQYGLVCKTCDKSIMLQEWKSHHSTIHDHQDAKYTCPQCDADFVEDLDLLCHISREHSGNFDICTICDQTFSTVQEVTSHWMMYHTHSDIMFCHVCGSVCLTLKKFQDHVIKKHSVQYIEVIVKGQDPTTGEDMQTDDSKHGAYKCRKCEKVFPHLYRLETHYMLTHTNLKPFSCDVCGRKYATQRLLTIHKKRLHTIGGSFTCEKCGKEYKSLLQLKDHIQNHKRKGKANKKAKLKMDSPKDEKSESTHEKCDKSKVVLQDPITNEDMFTTDSKPGFYKCQKCAETFPRPNRLEAHYMNIHTNLRPFSCDLCEDKFSTQCLLNRHKKRVHVSDGNLTCEKCGKEYQNKYKLQQHLNGHKYKNIKRVRKDRLPKKATCQFCNQTFQSRAKMIEHRLQIHSVKPYACKECPKRFYKSSTLNIHVANNHSMFTPYSCAICDFRFATKSALRLHIERHARGVQMPAIQRVKKSQANLPIQCELCGEICLGKEYKAHQAAKHKTPSWPPLGDGSVDGKLFRCVNCEEVFEEFNLYKKHFVGNHSNVESHQCIKCSETFQTKVSLANHMKESHSDRTFNCVDCESNFDTAKLLKDHQRIHGVCEICNKQFSSGTTLRRHKRSLHGDDKPYQCDQCPQRFITPSRLTRHVQHKHIGKIYCTICDKHFPNFNLLRKHRVLTHNIGKLDTDPTPCDICGKTLKGNQSLQVHMRNVHGTSAKSFQCHLCGKEFCSVKYCSAHIRQAHKEKDLADTTCVHCGRIFASKGSMLRHVSALHPNVSPPAPLQCTHCAKIFSQEKHLENHILVEH